MSVAMPKRSVPVRKHRLVAVALVGLIAAALVPTPVGSADVVERRRIGRSVRNREIRAVNVGAQNHNIKVLVVGCIHGNECAGKAVIRRLRGTLSPRGFELWLVKDLNPDGSARRTRHNARGVDLNRNFRTGWRSIGEPWDTYYSGPRSFSEPETRAARRLIKDLRPDITIWYHQAMRLVTKRKRHPRIPRIYARAVGLPLKKLDPLPGTASRWQNRSFPGHISFVVELPAGRLSTRSVRRHARAVRTVGRAWEAKR